MSMIRDFFAILKRKVFKSKIVTAQKNHFRMSVDNIQKCVFKIGLVYGELRYFWKTGKNLILYSENPIPEISNYASQNF